MSQVAEATTVEESFEEIYRGHARDVYRYSLSRLRNPADAEDATQATFLNAYQALSRGHRPEQPRLWLLAVARNICRDRYRRALRRPREVELTPAAHTVHEELPCSVSELLGALEAVPENERTALLGYELGGLSRAELAEELGGTTENAVSTLLLRARRNVREQVDHGMSCSRVRTLRSSRSRRELPPGERHALELHLRSCIRCSAKPRRVASVASLLPTLWLWLGRLSHRVSESEAVSSAGTKGAAGIGASLAAKVAVVAAVGAVAGGIGYETVGHPSASPSHQRPAPVSPARPAPVHRVAAAAPPVPVALPATGRRRATLEIVPLAPFQHHGAPASRPVTVPAPARVAVSHAAFAPPPAASATAAAPSAVVSEVSTTPVPAAHSPANTVEHPAAVTPPPTPEVGGGNDLPAPAAASSSVTPPPAPIDQAPIQQDPVAEAPPASAPVPPAQPAAETPAPPVSVPNSPPPAATPLSGGNGQQTAPGQQGTAGNGRATAPGQQNNPGNGQVTAPGQQNNPGNGQASAPGQQNNGGNGQATAPGQQGTAGNGQATAPGQQDTGQPNDSGNGQATAPGQQDTGQQDTGQPNGGGNGQATAPGQQDTGQPNDSGNGQATAPGQQDTGQPNGGGNGQANAPGQQDNPGQGNGHSSS
jgi:RNA polymerase sigma factor (sigma-70 family)